VAHGRRSLQVSMIRICHVTTHARAQLLFLRGQNHFLRARGFEVHAVTARDAELDELVRRDGVIPHAVSFSRRMEPMRDLVALGQLIGVLRRVRPHILHVSTPKAALLGALAGKVVGVRVRVLLLRGLFSEGATGRSQALLRWAERISARLCHQTICVSPSLLIAAREEGILRSDEGIVIGSGMSNGVDLSRFNPAAVEPWPMERRPPALRDPGVSILGFVGRLVPDKGLGELVQAWSILRARFDHARLLLVGDWESEHPADPAICKRLLDDPRVHITGFVSDVRPYLRCMDVLLFPSYREGFPNAPMEAAAFEVPTVAARATGSVDAVIDGRTGTLVAVRDAIALAAGAERYLLDPALRVAHGRAARARVEAEFTPAAIHQGLLDEYNRLLARR